MMCWCKDCKWYDADCEECTNANSDNDGDFASTYDSCEQCEPKKYSFVFPATKYVQTNTLELQLEHIRSEVGEAIREYMNGHLGDMGIEIMDIIHSCETLLRMRKAKGVDLEATKLAVIQKNADRGYYERSGNTFQQPNEKVEELENI